MHEKIAAAIRPHANVRKLCASPANVVQHRRFDERRSRQCEHFPQYGR
jgi:hypothetical protein